MPHYPLSESMAGYAYAGERDVLDVTHIGLRHESGAPLVMPATVLESLDEHPEILEAVGSVAAFAATHDGYRDYLAVTAEQDVKVLRHALVEPMWRRDTRASVYQTKTDNPVIIKAFDLAPPTEAAYQYAVMSSLAEHLVPAADEPLPVRAPRQLAMVQSPYSNHRTIVMEAASGEDLQQQVVALSQRSRLEERIAHSHEIREKVRETISRQVPEMLAPYVNDTDTHLSNILVDTGDTEPSSFAELMSGMQSLTLLDQPLVGSRVQLRGRIARVPSLEKLL